MTAARPESFSAWVEEHPGSLLNLVDSINDSFGAALPGNTPIREIFGEEPNDNGGRPVVILLGEGWQKVDATINQRERICVYGHKLLQLAEIKTIDDLLTACAAGKIAAASGLGYAAQAFFAGSFRRKEA
jgi:hypothetical protein